MAAVSDISIRPAIDDCRWLAREARGRRLRTMREFAEQEMVIPDGPFKGRRFNCQRQPFTRLWLDEIDRGHWRRAFSGGPAQSGKSLLCFVLPVLYHLFEVSETVIVGLPDMGMASDKWHEDILPAIEATQYRELLPRSGAGSRGGTVLAIRFTHGATLRFMSGGGSDKSRAGYTSRVVVITEVDGLDEAGGKSREADKISQIEARTQAYGRRARIYGECTFSVEEGRIHREITHGSAAQIVAPCPHCRAWVTPERAHLGGWRDQTTKLDALEAAHFGCPACGAAITNDQRVICNQEAVLVHRGQEVTPEGQVVGPLPRTDTLGFRWGAFHNLFVTPGDVGAAEWDAARADDEDLAERKMCQFWWGLPYKPPATDVSELKADALAQRTTPLPRGIVPTDTQCLTVGIDVGKWLVHWMAVAWRAGGSGHVVDYGRIDVASDHVAPERAILAALRELRDMISQGWLQRAADGPLRPVDAVRVDAGYEPDTVYAFTRESGPLYMPTKGYGATQDTGRIYPRPKSTGALVRAIGQDYHVSKLAKKAVSLVEYDADAWKSWIHRRLATPVDQAGAMTFYQGVGAEHTALIKHLTAETLRTEWVAGRGMVARWFRTRRSNHLGDCAVLAAVGAHQCGLRVIETREPAGAPPTISRPASPAKPGAASGWFANQRKRKRAISF